MNLLQKSSVSSRSKERNPREKTSGIQCEEDGAEGGLGLSASERPTRRLVRILLTDTKV